MANLQEILLALRSPETYPVFNTIRYAIFKDRQNRLSHKSQAKSSQSLPGRLTASKPMRQGGIFNFENAQLEVIFLAADLVRVSWTSEENESPPIPYALEKTDWRPLDIGWRLDKDRVTLTSPEVAMTIYLDGGIGYQSNEGNVLRRDAQPEHSGKGWTSRAFLRGDEAIFGMGEHAGVFNLRGQTRKLWNTDPGGKYGPASDPIYMPIPVYISVHNEGSYIIFYENYHRGEMAFDPAGPVENAHVTTRFKGGMLRHYFIPGPVSRAVERYTELTGRAGMPPRWSLGYHQSRWGYKNEKDVQDVVNGFKEHKLPLSAIHLDIDYMDGYRVFTVDQNRFPDFQNLVKNLKDSGIKTVTIIDPGVKKDPEYELYQDGVRRGAFCRLPDGSLFTGLVWPGWTVFPDFTDPQTREWWGNYYQRLLEAGIDGFWHDMNEPCSFSAWGGLEFPDNVCHHLEGQDGDHVAAHNIYALQMNRAGYEGLLRWHPERRPWLVSRSGWAGQQRYAWNWTGDTESTWNGLEMTLSTVLSLGLSGFPYSGPDIGGFSGTPTQELYLRWFQLATFLPFFRTHSAAGTPRREPWVYDERTTEIIRKFLHIRYRLLPYLYTLAWEASQTGHPLVRPYFWYGDEKSSLEHPSYQLADSFYLGKALFVAPIFEEGCTLRQVTLPQGSWYDFWDDKQYDGSNMMQIPARLDQIPLFVRAGSLLPMEEGMTLYLHVYIMPVDRSMTNTYKFAYQLYSDAGDGFGSWRLDSFDVAQVENEVSIQWDSRGDYPFPYNRVIVELHGADLISAAVDDQVVPYDIWCLDTVKFKQAVLQIYTHFPQF